MTPIDQFGIPTAVSELLEIQVDETPLHEERKRKKKPRALAAAETPVKKKEFVPEWAADPSKLPKAPPSRLEMIALEPMVIPGWTLKPCTTCSGRVYVEDTDQNPAKCHDCKCREAREAKP